MSSADPRQELGLLVAALRGHVQWAGSTGAWGLPWSETGRDPATAGAPHAVAPHIAPVASGLASEVLAPVARRTGASATAPPERPGASRSAGPSAPTPPASIAAPTPAPPVPALPPEERRVRLQAVAEAVRACTACALHRTRTQTVFARGDGSSGLCFVGEGPGADEDARGLPFVGAAGQLLDRMIAAMGFSRDEVYVCNIVKCRPPENRRPEPEEMEACRSHLEQQLALVEPRVVVALGATAVQGLFGATAGITRLRGQWKLYRGLVPVMPTFHPAYLLRKPAAKREVWQDLRKVVEALGREVPARGGG